MGTRSPSTEELVLNLVDQIITQSANANGLFCIRKQLQDCCGKIRKDKRSAERQLRQLKEAFRHEQGTRASAERLNEAKDQAFAKVAHDLKGSVNVGLIWINIIGKGTLAPEQRRAVDFVVQCLEAQRRLIDDLLDASRIARGGLQVNREPVDIAVLARSTVELMRPMALAKGVELQEEGTVDCAAQVIGDDIRLGQVLGNLLNNAIKFTPAGKWVKVALGTDSDRVRIQVSDGGCGIYPDLLPELFKPLTQGGSRASRTGMGLGLSIAAQIVSLHGGSIHAASEGEGRGATFTVLLPACGETPATGLPFPSPTDVRRRRRVSRTIARVV